MRRNPSLCNNGRASRATGRGACTYNKGVKKTITIEQFAKSKKKLISYNGYSSKPKKGIVVQLPDVMPQLEPTTNLTIDDVAEVICNPNDPIWKKVKLSSKSNLSYGKKYMQRRYGTIEAYDEDGIEYVYDVQFLIERPKTDKIIFEKPVKGTIDIFDDKGKYKGQLIKLPKIGYWVLDGGEINGVKIPKELQKLTSYSQLMDDILIRAFHIIPKITCKITQSHLSKYGKYQDFVKSFAKLDDRNKTLMLANVILRDEYGKVPFFKEKSNTEYLTGADLPPAKGIYATFLFEKLDANAKDKLVNMPVDKQKEFVNKGFKMLTEHILDKASKLPNTDKGLKDFKEYLIGIRKDFFQLASDWNKL